MNFIPAIIIGIFFIAIGIIAIIFSKFIWLNDFGANNRKGKFDVFERKDTVFSGYLLIFLGLLMSVGGAISQW